MSNSLGRSSELYFIDPQDIANLVDAPASAQVPSSDIVILMQPNLPDTLLCGRTEVEQAIQSQIAYIPVRFVFASTIPLWNLAAVFIKPLRARYKYESKNIYHTSLQKLKELQIERGVRNEQNAYQISKRWNFSEEDRKNRYNELKESLKNGFDDRFPLSIMLCRRGGVKDCIDDGHHRIGICVEENIDRVAIRFRAAGKLPLWIQKLVLWLF